MTVLVGLKSGYDVNYFTSSGAKGCAGAMRYYTEGGEPPGQWAGRAARGLGLVGVVDADVIRRLYMENVSPAGEVLAKRLGGKRAEQAEEAAVAAFRGEHPFASAVEVGEYRSRQRAKAGPKSVPYFDLTISAVKSVSVLHASYRVAAMQAREAGAVQRADALDARADAIEAALMDAADEAVRWLEAHHTRTRTGYHSKTTGEWRDGAGLTAARFLHHLSRDGDPQLHVHVAIWNHVQRADGADDQWRTLYGRDLYQNKLGLQPVPDRFLEARMRALGYKMVQRADGNGCEVDGVDAAVIKQFSSRAVAVGAELAKLAADWSAAHGGKQPSQRTLWLLHQQAGQNTRRTKAEARRTVNGTVHRAEPTDAERMAEWEAGCTDAEVRALSTVYPVVEGVARAAAPPPPPGAGTRARGGADDGADDGAAGGAGAVLPPLTPVPDLVLDLAEMRRFARVAVANVQKRHAAWTWAQLRFEVHRALPAGATAGQVEEIARLAVSGRAGTDVVQVGSSPDVADVTPLGVRATDGGSVYRPPGEERWCTVDHLDLEAWITDQGRRRRGQLVSEGEARAAVALTDLTDQQAAAVVRMLTGTTVMVPLDAAAGSGKSHTMAVFAELWTRFTGGRVIGLTTSTNAARVLANEGLAESYNIAEFLGKTEGSEELRRPVAVHERDVLVVDEATQCSTADMAALLQATETSGARLYPVGDTAQLGAVDAGGIFALVAEEIDSAHLSEVLRFRHGWETAASLRLRRRDAGVFAVYDRRGRIRGADHEAMFDRAAGAYLADLLRGRDVLLLAGSNAEASDLARRVQAKLIELGRVAAPVIELADGNHAGPGDLVRARLNTRIDAGGQRLSNRDTLRVVSVQGDQVLVQRRTGPDAWSWGFPVPAEYLGHSGELDYAGNVHVAQGRTVDAGHLAVTQSLDRRGLLVGATRGRDENTFHVETGNTAPEGKPAYEQATPESVLAGVLDRDADELSATATMRAGQDWAHGAGHVLHLWSEAVKRELFPQIDREVMARLPADLADRYRHEWAREAFHQRLREAQLAGHDIGELISRVMADALDGARSVASVLHSRLSGLGLDTRHDVSWAQRTPDGAPELARELAEGLDNRVAVLGERAAARPEPWLLRHLGQLDPAAGAALRGEYERRAGQVAAYREAAGITDPERAVAVEPHAGNPELETFRKAAMHALEIRDEAELLAGMGRGELEALVADGERARASAPRDVSEELRLTGQAKADTWAQAAAAKVRGDAAEAASAAALAAELEAKAEGLDVTASAYEQWSGSTAAAREQAGKAAAELARREPDTDRGQDPDAADTRPGLVDWWRQFEANMDRVEAALDAEEAAAREAGEPWPPEPRPAEAEPGEAERVIAQMRADGLLSPEPAPEPEEAEADPETLPWTVAGENEPEAAGSDTQAGPQHAPPQPVPDPPDAEAGAVPPGLPEPANPRGAQPVPAASPPPEPEPEPEPAAGPEEAEPASAAPTVDHIDALQAQAEAAAGRAAAERDEQAASAEYTARQRAEAEHEASWQAQLADGEMEPEA